MSRSSVDLPAPLIPTSPQRPAGTSRSNSEKTGVPSDQAKLTDDRLMTGLDMREAPKRHEGRVTDDLRASRLTSRSGTGAADRRHVAWLVQPNTRDPGTGDGRGNRRSGAGVPCTAG